MKRILLIVGSLILTAGIILYAFSFQIAVAKLGMDHYMPITSGFDGNGREYRVVGTFSESEPLALAYVTKKFLGIWVLEMFDKKNELSDDWACLAWGHVGGVRRYAAQDDPVIELGSHIVYAGNNAVKFIEFLPGQLPDNTTVSIQQAGPLYIIHLLTYNSERTGSWSDDIYEMLLEAGFINA